MNFDFDFLAGMGGGGGWEFREVLTIDSIFSSKHGCGFRFSVSGLEEGWGKGVGIGVNGI